jgi:ferredoxin
MRRESNPQVEAGSERDEIRTGSEPAVDRRDFLRRCGMAAPILLGVVRAPDLLAGQESGGSAGAQEILYGMGVDVEKCIGCARCAVACKIENDVPPEEEFFNTWIERYVIYQDSEVQVDSPNGGMDGFPELTSDEEILRTFFAITVKRHPASRSARSGPPSSRQRASSWWTRATASGAATASRPAPTAPDGFTRRSR